MQVRVNEMANKFVVKTIRRVEKTNAYDVDHQWTTR